MSILSSLTGKEHEAFGRQLADEFMKIYPADLTRKVSNKRIKQKYTKALNRVNMLAKEYGNNVKPGVYGKAKVGNTFMWALKEQGYNDELVESLTNILLHSISHNQ